MDSGSLTLTAVSVEIHHLSSVGLTVLVHDLLDVRQLTSIDHCQFCRAAVTGKKEEEGPH